MKEIILAHPILSFVAFCVLCQTIGWIVTTYFEERENKL